MALDFPDSPAVGDLYGGAGTTWRWDGTIWASTQGASGARGRVAFAQTITMQGGITNAAVDLVGLSVTWTADPTRTYKTTLHVETQSSVAGDVPVVNILDAAGTGLQRSANAQVLANVAAKQHAELIESGLSGLQTRKANMVRALGGGTMTTVSSPGLPAFILVEDITYEAGSSGVGIEPTAWIAPAMLNGWTSYGPTPVMYRKVGDIVYLRGYIVAPNPINSSPWTTLPAGFGAGANGEFITSGYAGARAKCTMTVDTAGTCTVHDGIAAAGTVALAQISWSTTP